MLLNPAIIALLCGSLLTTAFALYASAFGIQILRGWDLRSGSEQQLLLERRTYLISTIFSCLLGFNLVSLFLFVYAAEHLHNLFVGAMCAAGSLNANGFGYPTLVAKMISFILCSLWLVLNYTDYQAADYPLIRIKYRFLLLVTGWLTFETLLHLSYFLLLKADVITSCCGSLFSENSRTITADLASLPPYGMKILFYLSAVVTFRTGISFCLRGKAPELFSAFSAGLLLTGLLSVVSFISVYFYQLPTHHCPFCLLQKDYGYIGYPLYASLFTGGIMGLSVGMLERFRTFQSLGAVIPELQKRFCIVSLGCYAVFVAIASYPLLFSELRFHTY